MGEKERKQWPLDFIGAHMRSMPLGFTRHFRPPGGFLLVGFPGPICIGVPYTFSQNSEFSGNSTQGGVSCITYHLAHSTCSDCERRGGSIWLAPTHHDEAKETDARASKKNKSTWRVPSSESHRTKIASEETQTHSLKHSSYRVW